MSRITAHEARELAGPTLDEKIDDILIAIKEAAKNKHRSLKTSWEYKKHDDLWVNGGYSNSLEWKQAKKILEDLGFHVKFYYSESQFVDMYTLISW